MAGSIWSLTIQRISEPRRAGPSSGSSLSSLSPALVAATGANLSASASANPEGAVAVAFADRVHNAVERLVLFEERELFAVGAQVGETNTEEADGRAALPGK